LSSGVSQPLEPGFVAELDRLVAEAPFPFGTDWKRGSMTTTPATERGGGAFIACVMRPPIRPPAMRLHVR